MQLLFWGVWSELELPQEPAPEGAVAIGMQVSWEHSAVLESFFTPSLPPLRPPAAPGWPPTPSRPVELAPGPGPAPFSSSGRRWMEAETLGQGRGARRPGAPLCAQGRPSPTRRPLPCPRARGRASDLLRRENCISGL